MMPDPHKGFYRLYKLKQLIKTIGGSKMLIMGTNTWKTDLNKDILTAQTVKFGEQLNKAGVAELKKAWLDYDNKLLWCLWDSKNNDALRQAFDKMNEISGMSSKLSIVDDIDMLVTQNH